MSLPDLALQIVYGRLAWALVAVAILLAIVPALAPARWLPALKRAPSGAGGLVRARPAMALLAALAVALLALAPAAATPSYWLTLVFQYPSGLLVGWSLVSLHARWRGQAARFVMPAGFALPLVVAGLLLYLDAFGVLALGLYTAGFSAVFAPLFACAAVAACALAIVGGRAAGDAAALLIGVLLFSLLRLPSGNLWDALLDPLLWSWALGSVVVAMLRQAAARRAGQPAPQAGPEVDPELEPALAHANDQI